MNRAMARRIQEFGQAELDILLRTTEIQAGTNQAANRPDKSASAAAK